MFTPRTALQGLLLALPALPSLATPVDDDTQPFYTNNTQGEVCGVDVFINKGLIDRWYGWLAISASRSLGARLHPSLEFSLTPIFKIGSCRFTVKPIQITYRFMRVWIFVLNVK